jgi:hypothetical protein
MALAAACTLASLPAAAEPDDFARYALKLRAQALARTNAPRPALDWASLKTSGWIKNIKITQRDRGVDLVKITLDRNTPMWNSVASSAAMEYKAQLKCDEADVFIYGPSGNYLTSESWGTPRGMHWQQTGYDFQTDQCGRLQVYPHYELLSD